jgi:hypothetical protein
VGLACYGANNRVTKKKMAKNKGQSKEGQFVEVPSNMGQKIKFPFFIRVPLTSTLGL